MTVDKKKILIVDDEETFCFAFKDVLSGPLLSVDTAQSLEETIQFLRENSYHGAVIDLRLSGTRDSEGFEAIQSTKKHSPHCKIIVLTAFAKPGTKEKVFTLGADYFMEKPALPVEIKKIFQSMGAL